MAQITRTFSDTRWHRHDTVSPRDTIQTTDEIRQVIEYRKVMLDDHDVIIVIKKASNRLSSLQSLFDVEIAGRFVKHIPVFQNNSEFHVLFCSLQFKSRPQAQCLVHHLQDHAVLLFFVVVFNSFYTHAPFLFKFNI